MRSAGPYLLQAVESVCNPATAFSTFIAIGLLRNHHLQEGAACQVFVGLCVKGFREFTRPLRRRVHLFYFISYFATAGLRPRSDFVAALYPRHTS
jgi:hypothetical protein